VSMISEAISSGRRVVVFSLAKKKATTSKHERSLAALAKEGYIEIAEPQNLASSLETAWTASSPAKELKDRERIFEAVRRLI